MGRLHRHRYLLLAAFLFLLLPFLWFAPVIIGGKTLLPADILYTFQPWKAFAAQLGVGVPHNGLLADLILENYVWKLFLRRSFAAGQLPLWNPYLFSGVPFLAAGQHSGLYPLSLLYDILPLAEAYGVFTWLQLAIAGFNSYILARVLRRSHGAAIFAGIAYAFSGFFIVSVVFPMIIGAAAWLPLLLAIIEMAVRKQETNGRGHFNPTLYIIAGALIFAVANLAGHVEITYYIMLVAGFYALWRLLHLWRKVGAFWPALRLGIWLLVMMGAGLALSGVQIIPLYELVRHNFRAGGVSYHDVVGWAWPNRQWLTFVLPDVFGNPSHHAYFDIWQRVWRPAQNSQGQPVAAISWGVKNYVEGGNYLGILTLISAAIAGGGWIVSRWRRWRRRNPFVDAENAFGYLYVPLFAVLALTSLLFAFGTPLYALLYYTLPGFNQLHSPFRWVFPYTLAMTQLAAFGVDGLAAAWRRPANRRWLRALFAGLGSITLLLLAILALSLLKPGPFVAFGRKVLAGSDLARGAFPNGAMFWSYQWLNLLKLTGALAGALVVIWAAGRRWGRQCFALPAWQWLAIVALFADLWLIGGRFNPAADPAWLHFTPPAVQFLQKQPGFWRFTSFDAGAHTKTMNANSGWRYNFQDIRGYDSIIPRQYVRYMQAIEPQGQLIFNRIAPFYRTASLQSGLTDLLGVKYVLSEAPLHQPGYTEVYNGEIRIYRNEHVLPRAFGLTCTTETVGAFIFPLAKLNPRQMLLLDDGNGEDQHLLQDCHLHPATITSYGNNQVWIDVDWPRGGTLLLADAYFPGWKAYYRPIGGTESDEQALTIRRADGNFRAVQLPPGRWSVRFKYSPMAMKLGLYTTFIALVSLFLLFGLWAWGRFYRDPKRQALVVAKNSLVPMFLSLFNKGIDFAFAMLRLRILSPAGEGSYTFAIAFYGFFEILVRFGLGTLLTRDVAQDKSKANRYLTNVIVLRTLLWFVALPLMAAVGWAYNRWGGLTTAEAQTIVLFTVALFFASIADAFSAVFNAFEKMEYPAGIASAVAVTKVAIGAIVLLFGGGFVGLAAIAVFINMAQAGWLYLTLRRVIFRPHFELHWGLQKMMLNTSAPLMINHLLATIFFRIDIWILKPLAGVVQVGLYSAAYKYLDGLNVIPAYFTLAIFPLMSRYARDREGDLSRTYHLALRLLLGVAFPIVVFVLFAADPLISILGGVRFLPGSAIALRLLILSTLVGFVNSVTQYVLIAVDQQRFLTKAFIIGVTVNLTANILFIPKYGYLAASVITIVSEIALFIPFYYAVRKHIAPVPWLRIVWRPLAGGVIMAAVTATLHTLPLLGALTIGFAAYLLALWAFGLQNDPDVRRLLAHLGLRRRLSRE